MVHGCHCCCHLIFCFSMPPRRSQRLSGSATEVPLAPAPKRRKAQQKQPAKKVNSQQKQQSNGQEPQTISPLSDQAFEQLVSRVSAEVTKAITPLLQTVTHQQQQPLPQQNRQHQPDGQSPLVELPIGQQNTTRPSTGATVDNIIDLSLNTLNSSLQGETQSSCRPSQMFHSVGLSLDAAIPDKVKTKIINNEYFDFGTLIANHLKTDDKFQLSITNGRGNQPSLCLEPSSKTKRIATIESWMSAFRIFVAVYAQTYPGEAPALMKYGDLIQDLASRGHDWRFYDENFRFMRQREPGAYPWGTIQWELWLRSQVNVKVSQPNLSSPLPKGVRNPAIPKGYCYRFQRGRECSGCDYKHVCFKCERNHGGLQCNFRPPTGTTQVAGQSKSKSTNQVPAHPKSYSSHANKG